MDIAKDRLKRAIRHLERLKDQEMTDKYDYLIDDLREVMRIVRPEPTQKFHTPRIRPAQGKPTKIGGEKK